ncbi:MAG: DNA double-strand break repair nuclease NurA [Candidatus Bathyarchaeota archaeon]|nr:DNA double-strand break repair nuclease NurA [Candidatus Bathyarchaeota archaeon]MCX8177035.1 DNA double-strand break repair nuclease NurA [Candidatus Bathyarchaeota archaeon]MDW8194226.1 DNA double-strand break repair nuclease NurA [Nitrososphaerota archaeon]
MIEQYTIATTQKYNFPQPTIDPAFPQRFIELSLNSLRNASSQPIQLNRQEIQKGFNEPLYAPQPPTKPIPLYPRSDETPVAAVDTSSIKLGETSRGIVVAIRGTSVWKIKRNYGYLRVGPFIFHITDENLREVYSALQRAYFPELKFTSPSFLSAPMRMANLLEKWLQATLAKSISNGVILFDGSLTAGTLDTPSHQLREILTTARRMGNTVLAFAKATSLRFNGYIITEIIKNHKPPCLLEVPEIKPRPPITLLGEVYVAKLSMSSCAFRLDIDKEVPPQQRIEAVERLLGNDLLTQSYPETLRLSHILCTFTANEVIAMQHFINKKFGLKIITKPDMHRLLFGPFGKGENSNEAV